VQRVVKMNIGGGKALRVAGPESIRRAVLAGVTSGQIEVFRQSWREREQYFEHHAVMADAGTPCHCERPEWFKWLEGG
jgi:hypothetical protein